MKNNKIQKNKNNDENVDNNKNNKQINDDKIKDVNNKNIKQHNENVNLKQHHHTITSSLNQIQNQSYLSIDVGCRNLGYSIISSNFDITFGIYDLSKREYVEPKQKQTKNKKCINYIIVSINNFLNDLFNKYHINTLIIEKQVKRNIRALNVMWIIIEYCLINNCRIILFNAGDKFKYEPGLKYDSKHKEHKKICVRYAKNIFNYFGIDIKLIDEYRKKDDISDSICMLFIVYYTEFNKSIKQNISNFKIDNKTKNEIKKMMVD
jgi:hypothetical protein